MDCVAGSQLVDMLGGTASAELAMHIDAHVDRCSSCRKLMENLARVITATGSPRSRTETAAPTRPSQGRNTASVSHRYRILGLLGEGGMGRVYRALDRLTGTEVALKQVLIAPLDTELTACEPPGKGDGMVMANRGALAEEFRTLAMLRHPNVISVTDYGFDADGQAFYTMELLHDVKPLLQFAQGRSAAEQIELLIQLLYALAYLHRRGIVHRDLTPSNVLVVRSPQGPIVKVVDFGLAVNANGRSEASVAGTLRYMAPELFRGAAASEASDLYAVGAMAYQMLAGRYPFEADRGAAQLLREVLEKTPDLSALSPAMRPVLGRALSKSPENRQADAATLLRELAAAADFSLDNEPVAARDSYLLAARFVGRQSELRRLQTALYEAQRGRGTAWLVGGESGVGKSRLVEELRSRALVAGFLTARGQAVQGGTAYHLWQEVLRIVALQVPLGALEASVIGAIVPDLPRILECEVASPQALDAASARLRLLHVVGEVMQRLPEKSLVILEDLHYADSESLALLAHITGGSAGRLFLVATYRDDEMPSLPTALMNLQRMQLSRLDRKDMEQLCESMLGSAGTSRSLVDFIAAETEGNTFFMVEVMRALAAESGSLDNIGRNGLPERVFAGGMQDVLDRRLSRVPEEARTLLHLAAVAGRQLDLALLSHLLPHAEAQIRELADLGILELHTQLWRFSHDKLRDRVRDAMNPSERQELHARIAQAVEHVYSGDDGHAAQTAYHYREAHQLAAAARSYRVAGDGALRRGAPGEATAMFEHARTLHQRVNVPRVEQVQVWRGLAAVRFARGRFGEAEGALRQVCALAGAPLPADPVSLWSMVGRKAVALLAGRVGLVRRAPPSGTAERTVLDELHVTLGLEELFVWTDQVALGILCSLWEMSLDHMLSPEPGRTYHSSGLFFVLSHTPLRGLCRRYLDRYEGRIASGTHTEINFLRVRALVEINHSDFAKAAQYAAQAVALARKYKDDSSLLHSLLQLQLAAAGLDDFRQMLAVSCEMEELAARADNPLYLALAYIGQGGALINLGDYAGSAALIEKARVYLPQELGPVLDSVTLGLLASCARHLRQFERAEALAEKTLDAVRRARWPLVQLRYPLGCLLDVYLYGETAEHLSEKIEEALARLHQLARQFPQAVPVDEMFRGLYFWRYGQPRRALKSFRRSIQAAEKLKMSVEKAQTQYWLGCFANSPAGRGLVREGAEPHLHAALATFELLGMAGAVAYTRAAMQPAAG